MQTNQSWAGLVGSLGVLAIVLVGLGLITRGLMPNLNRSGPDDSQPRSGGGSPLGKSAASILSVAVIYRYFFTVYGAGYLTPMATLALAAAVVAGMALVPAVETLVAIAALFLFLTENIAQFGISVVTGLVIMLVVFNVLRKLFGR